MSYTPPGPPPAGMTPPPADPNPPVAAPEPSFGTPFPQPGDGGFTVDAGFAAVRPPRPTTVKAATGLLIAAAVTILLMLMVIAISMYDSGFSTVAAVLRTVPLGLIPTGGFLALAGFVWLGRDGARITAFACCGAASISAAIVVVVFAVDVLLTGSRWLDWVDVVMPLLLLLGTAVTGATIALLAGRSANDWFYQLRRARAGRL